MRLIRGRKVLCLLLAMAVTFLLGPAALAAPAGDDLRLAVQFADESLKYAGSEKGPWGLAVPASDEPSLTALQHGEHHRHHCERARHHCREHCRHREGHHHHNCFRHCMRERGCHHED